MASKSLGTLTLDLVARTAGFVKGMDAAERKTDAWKRKVKRNIDATTKSLVRLSTIGAAGLVASFGAVVRASVNQENALKQIEQRLISTGGVAGKTSKELQALANSLQNATTFGDEDILDAQSKLLTFTSIAGEQFDRTLNAVLDLSVAMDQDLKSSVVQLGKAINDPVANLSALSRVGIQFTEQQKESIKTLVEQNRLFDAQTIILDELERQFGGSAAAAAETFGGKLTQLSNAFGDLLENPAGLKANTEELGKLVEFLQDPSTVAAANKLTSSLINGFTATAESLRTVVGLTQFLAEELASVRAGAASDDILRLEDQLALAKRALADPTQRLRFFGPGGIVEYYDEDELRAEIAKLESAIDRERDRLQAVYRSGLLQPITVDAARRGAQPGSQSPPGVAAVSSGDGLANIEVLAQERKLNEEVQKRLDTYEQYKSLVLELRTEEERLSDQLKERLTLLDEVKFITEDARREAQTRAIAQAIGEAPDVGNTSPEVTGAFSDIQRLNEDQERLEEWYQSKLELLRESRESELATQEAYNAQELALEEKHQEALNKIDLARQVVALSTAEETFGQLADAARQYAGESSGIYRALFAAEKAAAIARSLVAINTAIAQASASAPFPANLAAMAQVVAATSGLLSTITSASISGTAHDGIDSVPQTGTWLLEKGERVTTSETSAKLDRTLSDVQDGMGQSSPQNIRIVNAFDTAVIGDYLGSSQGEKIIMNAVRRNQRTLRSLSA